jgi:lysophospholipase L1-like esterase
MSQKQPLRILCFGDSLTAGYSGFGAIYHPYHEVLKDRLTEEFPDLAVQIIESGVPGDIAATSGFETRMNNECACRDPI